MSKITPVHALLSGYWLVFADCSESYEKFKINVLRRMAPSQSLSDHFRYAPREHTTFLHPYTTNNACSIRRGGCHECSFTSVAESHFRVRIVLKKKIAKISVSLDGTLEDGLRRQTPRAIARIANLFETDCSTSSSHSLPLPGHQGTCDASPGRQSVPGENCDSAAAFLRFLKDCVFRDFPAFF